MALQTHKICKFSKDIDSTSFQDQLQKHRLDPSEENPFLRRTIKLKKSEIQYIRQRGPVTNKWSWPEPKSSLSSVPTSQPQKPGSFLIDLPLDLLHMIFQTTAYKKHTIYFDQNACDGAPFHSLSKTCKGLREAIFEWASPRADIWYSPLFGPIVPSVTTFKVVFRTSYKSEEVRTYKAPQSQRQLFRLECWKYLMDRIKSNDLLKVQTELYRLFAVQSEIEPPENEPLEIGPQILVGFLAGVLGIPVEEITSDVIWKQDIVMDPKYEKLDCFSQSQYLGGGIWGGGIWGGGIWFGSKAFDSDNEEGESEDEESEGGEYYDSDSYGYYVC